MNGRRILLILSRFLALAAVAEALTIWMFWRSSWTPIERHYLPAYIWCSMPVVSPSTVEIRLIWKTGLHRKWALAADDDAVDSEDRTGMALSQLAIDAGWKTLIEGAPQQIPTELLRPDLAGFAFEGQSLWDFLLPSELSALVALCVALCAWFLFIEFLRALITEYAWRRRVSSRQGLLFNLFKDCVAPAQRISSELAALYKAAARRLEMHPAATSPNVRQAQPAARPICFALPLFGVCNSTRKGYVWSEKDEIN